MSLAIVSQEAGLGTDFTRHNEEVQQVWDAYRHGRPIRVPMGLGVGPRIWILNPELNTEGITWEAFSNHPELMFQTYLKYKHYLVHNVPHDIEMGIPEKEWVICTEFVNVHEAAWLGCDVFYAPGQVTATRPAYLGDRKREVIDRGLPGPFDGFYTRVKEYHEYFVERAKHYEFHGRPISVLPPCPVFTDGPLTVASDLVGSQILTDMILDEDFYHELMSFLTDAIIMRVKAWRKYLGLEERPAVGAIADDFIQCISTEAYVSHVLPYHQKFFRELYGEGPHIMHICGNVQRHFPTLVKELNIGSFDTGFPINYRTLRDEVGENVEFFGGVKIHTLLGGSPEQVRHEAIDVLQSGVTQGGKFIMKEANNLPPCVPVENVAAMYEMVKEYGRFSY